MKLTDIGTRLRLLERDETSARDRIDLTRIRIALDKTITVLKYSSSGGTLSPKALRYRDTHARLMVVVGRERMDGRRDRGG